MSDIIWRTEQRRVRDLVAYEYNPRQLTDEQRGHLTESLRKFGLADIPVVNPDNRIIGGHQRVKVLIALGRGDELIDVRIPSRPLTDQEFKEFVVRLNKNTGEWDWRILSESFKVDELKEWGFTEAEMGLNFGDNPLEEEPSESDGPKIITCPACGFRHTPQ
jgi:ParB-like chromosome segregation protein Spo0J